jgi:hypothetical protein
VLIAALSGKGLHFAGSCRSIHQPAGVRYELVSLSRARSARAQMLEGYMAQLAGKGVEEFAALAKTESDCGSAQDGGDLGEFGPGQMMAAFEDATAALKVGEMSGLVGASTLPARATYTPV